MTNFQGVLLTENTEVRFSENCVHWTMNMSIGYVVIIV